MKAIVIPVANTRPECFRLLDELLVSMHAGEYFNADWEIILCLDNCDNEFQNKLVDHWSGHNIHCISNVNPKNLNFCKNANIGMKFAYDRGAEHIYVLNMDTLLPPAKFLAEVAGKGLSFPNQVDISDQPDWSYKLLETQEAERVRTPVDRAGGFCMCFSRDLVETIGFLNERFTASFEDDLSCLLAHLAGFPVEVVNVDVHHYMRTRTPEAITTTGAYTNESLSTHWGIFRRMFSIPPQVSHDDASKWVRENYQWHPLLGFEIPTKENTDGRISEGLQEPPKDETTTHDGGGTP